jgi:hypothetical protein
VSDVTPPEQSERDDVWASLEPAAPLKPERKVDWLFFSLGVFTPIVLVVAMSWGLLPDAFGAAALAIIFVHIIASILMLIIGRAANLPRVRSYGLGGVVTYGLVGLAVLLLWGSCMLGQSN